MKLNFYVWAGAAAAIIIGIVVFFRINSPREVWAEKTFQVMGTIAEVKLYGPPEKAEKAVETVRQVFARVEKACSVFDPESELYRLNKTAHERPFRCGDILWDTLSLSRAAWAMSDGAFDITAKPLMDLWGFYRKAERLPSREETAAVLQNVGLDKVEFDDAARSVRLRKGMSLDLGGIAKGCAVDLAAEAVARDGISTGVINLAGNMRCLPTPPPGRKSFNIGVRHPVRTSEICGSVEMLGTSVSTSGNYERYVVIDGVRHTHIMNVKTGEPVRNMLSVTVVTPSAGQADFLSTAIFIKGADFAEKVCAKIPGTSVLVIDTDDGGNPRVRKFGRVCGETKL